MNQRLTPNRWCGGLLVVLLIAAAQIGCQVNCPAGGSANGQANGKGSDANVISLFDGKSLKGWKKTEFGGEGEVEVKDGKLIIGFGAPLTGVTWKGQPPARMNYEISLEAMRVDGSDFFCALTFPVGKSAASFVVGGWGGGVVGISSIDGFDASENETTQYLEFKAKKWYHIRVRVTNQKIEAWIDDKNMVDVETKGHTISVRIEVEPNVPLGIATFQTTGAIRNIKLTKLKAESSAPKQ